VALDLAPLAAHPAADVSAAADSEGDAEPQELPTLTWSHVVSHAPCDTHQTFGLQATGPGILPPAACNLADSSVSNPARYSCPSPCCAHLQVNVDPRSAVASEGLSLLAHPTASQLISFGGYNGKYHQDVHIFRPGGRSIIAGILPRSIRVHSCKRS
jgi:hypothetical protein